MFSHVMVGSSDIERSRVFYDAVLGTLGVKPGAVDRHRVFWRSPTGVFGVSLPINGQPATVGNGVMVALAARVAANASGASSFSSNSNQPSTGGQIQADPSTNALIITAPEPQYR